MDWQAVVKSIDELVFRETGEHLDSLQLAILTGVLNGQKYAAIAKKYGCTTGHARDEGYELWRLLSEVFGEKLNRSNLVATVERLGFVNYQHHIISNFVNIEHINICNQPESCDLKNRENFDTEFKEKHTIKKENYRVAEVLRETKFKAVDKLSQLGLTAEQIAESLDLPFNEVQEWME